MFSWISRVFGLCFSLQYLHMQGGFSVLTNKTDTKLNTLTLHVTTTKCAGTTGVSVCVSAAGFSVGILSATTNQWKLLCLTKE